MNKCVNNLLRKIFVVFTMVSLIVGVISVPSGSDAYAEGTGLPIDRFDDDYKYDYSDEDMYPYYNNLNDKQKHAYETIVNGIVQGVGTVEDYSYREGGEHEDEVQKVEEKNKIYFAKTDGEIDKSKALTSADFTQVIESIYNEHPELFWFGTIETDKVGYTFTSPAYYIDPTLPMPQKEDPSNTMYTGASILFNKYAEDLEASKKDFKSMVSDIISPTETMSDGEKAYYIHNKICELISYDYNGIETKNLDATVYGTLKNNRSVCQGYARTLQYLLRILDIPAHLVLGKASTNAELYLTEEGIGYNLTDWEDHAWIICNIDDYYYNIDVTWDDVYKENNSENKYSFINYNHFLVHDGYLINSRYELSDIGTVTLQNPFAETHIREKSCEFLPTCTQTEDIYEIVGISREQAFIDNFDRSTIDGVVNSESDYVEFDKKGVFEGSLGDVTFEVDKDGNVTKVSGSKVDAGNRLVKIAEDNNITGVPWKNINQLVESNQQIFILTGEELCEEILDYDRQSLIDDCYGTKIGKTNVLSSFRTINYYEFQNDCYLFLVNPDVMCYGSKTITKKATVIDWSERQGTIEVEKDSKLDLSGIKVKVYYNDFTSKEVDASTLTVSGFDSSKLGYQDVTLTYTGEKDMIVNTVKLHVKVNEVIATYTLGDVNDDGQVNSDDAIRVLMHVSFPDDERYALNQKSDFDGSGQVNSDDAIRVLMHVSFPDDIRYILIDS